MMLAWLSLLGGLVLLYVGAQVLIKGGAALAFRLGLTALVVGLTVIAYGTSSPELVVSVNAALQGNSAISIGNVVGSNICNIALVLAVCALVLPLTTSAQVIRREIPIMIAVSVLLALLAWDRGLGRFDGALLLGVLVAYTWLTIRRAREETAAAAGQGYDQEFRPAQAGLGRSVVLVVVGLALLVAGSHAFVTGAVKLAGSWGMSDAVIGLTVVAVGTSLPELATSLVAAIRGHGDVAIGNVVGSNVFNVLGIVGISAVLKPIDTSGLSRVDLAMMLLTAVALLPLARTGGRISRREGAGLLVVYAGYTVYLISRVT